MIFISYADETECCSDPYKGIEGADFIEFILAQYLLLYMSYFKTANFQEIKHG